MRDKQYKYKSNALHLFHPVDFSNYKDKISTKLIASPYK